MRPVDGLRQHHPAEPSMKHVPQRQPNAVFEKPFPPVGVQDFQDYRYPPSRRPSTAHAHANVNTSNPPTPLLEARRHANQFVEHSRSDSTPRAHFLKANSSRNSGRHGDAPPIRPREHDPSRSPSPDSKISSSGTYETQATSLELPALQAQSTLDDADLMEPLSGDLAGSFDLVAPPEQDHPTFSLEARSELLFSKAHLEIIFSNSSSLLRFTAFLSRHRPHSVPILIYYLDALKALKAIKYANAIAEALSPIPGYGFTENLAQSTTNEELEEKASQAFTVLIQQDLPAYVTHVYIHIVSMSISRRITGTLAPHLREASEGLAEVFCLTDPSRPDNPIVFASEGSYFVPPTSKKRLTRYDRISQDYSIRYELCYWPELSIPPRSEDESLVSSQTWRRRQIWKRALRSVPQLVCLPTPIQCTLTDLLEVDVMAPRL